MLKWISGGGSRGRWIFGSGFTPAALFAAGEVGAWYDPSDLTTMFQDTAGTTPVTTPGQTVALLLDKSKGLVLGPQLVTNGDFDAGATGWAVGSPDWSIGAGVATYSGSVNANLSTSASIVVAGRWYEVLFSMVSGSGVTIAPYLINQASPLAAASFSNIGVGSYRCVLLAPSNGSLIFRRQGGSGFSIDNISVRELPGNHATQATAASRPTYQIDGGGRPYLGFDGVDDGLATGSIDFTATDKVSVFAGVRKLSDAATAVIAEYSANSGVTAGTWGLFSGGFSGGAAAYAANLNGSQRTSFDATTFTAPISNVLTSTFDIAGAARSNEIGVRVNGAIPTLTGGGNANAGTGNFSAQVVYIGRKAGTSAPLNGNIYGLIVRGAATDAANITSTETWLNAKTGAY